MKKILFVPMMPIIRTFMVFIFAGVPAVGQNKIMANTTKQESVIYTCTMHPEIQSNQPGACPKCGMRLVKKSQESQKQHKKHKMGMMCPMMNDMSGMENMEKNNSTEKNKTANDPASKTVKLYTCSMHPEIESRQEGICPKCGMTLIEKSAVSSGKEEKRHKMSFMGIGMGIGMGIMMIGMLFI